jgi:16S rRNA processing protein RimM
MGERPSITAKADPTTSVERVEPRLIEIGGVARAHGIRGEIVVFTHDPDSQILGDVDDVFVGDRKFAVTAARSTHRGWLVGLQSIATRNAAELLQGATVSVSRDDIKVEQGEVILDDMVGCEVLLVDGTSWGLIVEIDVGLQDRLIIVQSQPGEATAIERMLPLVDQFLVNIDIEAGVVTIDPPDGIPQHAVPASAAIVKRSRRVPIRSKDS